MATRYFLLIAALAAPPAFFAAGAAGCGGGIETSPDTDGGGGSNPSGTGVFVGPGTGSGQHVGSGADALPDYVDPGCPDAGPPDTKYECDPYHQDNGDCAFGQACDIFVKYPTEPCGQEVYGASCVMAGTGHQGDSCGGGDECAAGYICVVSGSGTQCIKLCELTGDDGCPSGLVCEPVDVQGFGGCL